MSVDHGGRAPPQVETVMTIWQDTLTEATLTVDQAISAAAMMLGLTIINGLPNEAVAHALLEDVNRDVHLFINANWAQGARARQILNGPQGYAKYDSPPAPGISSPELKAMLGSMATISPLMPPPPPPMPEGPQLISAVPADATIAIKLSPVELAELKEALQELPYRVAANLMAILEERTCQG